MARAALLASLLCCTTVSTAFAQEGEADDEAAAEPDGDDGATDEADAEARARFESGNEAFQVGDYERAAEEFRAAYELSQRPELLFNIYSAFERWGHLEEAADALERYLRDGDIESERRTSLEARLARLRERIADERAARAEAELEAERQREDGSPAVPAEESGGVHPAAIGLLIGGGVLLASFGVFAALAAAENGRLEGECGTTCNDDEVSTLRTFNLVADISWIAGAAVGLTGLVLLFALDGGDEERATAGLQLAPYVGGDGAGGVVRGSF